MHNISTHNKHLTHKHSSINCVAVNTILCCTESAALLRDFPYDKPCYFDMTSHVTDCTYTSTPYLKNCANLFLL